ncbi:MAG: helix-turn-helix transcriptional regulator [Polyangiaceae bacterium]|nr:helix-turn-helix transcriptional regulator [Polyangiaceae bacterium]
MTSIDDFPLRDLYEPHCPEREILDRIMSRWGALALLVLRERSYRFSELRRYMGPVSEKMLAQSLRVLEEDGFVLRHDYGEVPPRVEYSLTPMGRDLSNHVAALGKWVSDHASEVLAAREEHRRTGARPTKASV